MVEARLHCEFFSTGIVGSNTTGSCFFLFSSNPLRNDPLKGSYGGTAFLLLLIKIGYIGVHVDLK